MVESCNHSYLCVYRQCETCCCDSEDDLKPSVAPDGVTSSRSGRVINRPSAYKQSEETHLQVIVYDVGLSIVKLSFYNG